MSNQVGSSFPFIIVFTLGFGFSITALQVHERDQKLVTVVILQLTPAESRQAGSNKMTIKVSTLYQL